MSKICPKCKREIDENVKFCPFCAAFAGDKKEHKKKSRIGAVIGGIAGAAVLSGMAVAVFAFDIFGLFKNEPETLYGTGDKLFTLSMSPAKSGDKWGYIGKDGKFVISPQFDCAYPFDENVIGNAAVSNENGYGFINDKGEFTIEPTFRQASFYSDNGLSVVTAKDGYMLYVDGKGRTAYDNKHFTYAEPFSDGADYTFAYTAMSQSAKSDDGKDVNAVTNEYYLLKSDGKTVITLSDTSADIPYNIGVECVFGEYYVGFASGAEIYEGSNDFTKKVYAVFTVDGKQKSEWHDRIFVTEEFVVMCDSDSKTGIYKSEVYDKALNKVSDEYYCDRNQSFTDSGLVLMKIEDKRYRKVLVALKNGNLDEVYKESNGTAVISGFDNSSIACVYDKGKYCGYTANGKAFECDYPFTAFNCGLAPFYDNKSGKIGYINTNGEVVTKAQYDGVSEFYADGYAYVYENGKYGIIDISGRTIADKLSFAPTKLINNRVNHNWYTPRSFDGAEYYENTVNFGTMKVRGSGEYIYREEDDTYFSYDADKLIQTSDGSDVVENSELIYNYGEVDDGYAVIKNGGFYLIDSNGSLTRLSDSGADEIYITRYGDEYFYGFYDKSAGTLSMSDVNRNAVGMSYTGNVAIGTFDNGFALKETNSSNILRTHYEIYTDDIKKPFVINTNNEIAVTGIEDNIVEMAVQYYGSVDDSGGVRRIVDKATGECLLSQRTQSGYLYSLGGYFAVIQPSQQDIYTDENGQLRYTSDSDIICYTTGGIKVGSFITASAFDDKLLAVSSDGKYHIFSRYGELLGEYDYACMNEKSQYIVVKNGGKYVCLDRRMNEVFESEYPFNPPVNNYAAYADINSGKLGYLDMNGEVAIPAFADFLSDFSTDGYARVTEDRDYILSKTATERLIDTSGKTAYDSSNFATQTKGFEHGKEYFKTLYCFDGGYRYYIDYCKAHKDELTEYRNVSYDIGLSVYVDTISDLAENVLYQFVPVADRIKYINSIKILDDGTPVIAVNYRVDVGADYSDYLNYDPSVELRYYRLDGSQVKIEKHGNAESTVFVNGYFFESVLDGDSKQQTLYVYDCDGKEKYSLTAPEYYAYLDAKAVNGYVFTFRYYYNYDKYKEPDENAPIMAEVYDPNGEKLVECDNVYYSDAGFSENNNDEIRFTCNKGNGMKEDRIYSLSQGKFVRTENEEVIR